jgi:hypothetical protein
VSGSFTRETEAGNMGFIVMVLEIPKTNNTGKEAYYEQSRFIDH